RPAGVVRRALLRVLAVAALALAGLLVFGLLPGGRDASAVTPSPQPLPVAPAVHYLHPHGPNRAPAAQIFRLAITMLARADRMPTPKITLPKTKTWGGMPTRVAP